MQELEQEIKVLIVEALTLADVRPEDIVSTEPLFGAGLGLDSIDLLELAMALSRRYGIEFDGSTAENERIFASVESLARHVAAAKQATTD